MTPGGTSYPGAREYHLNTRNRPSVVSGGAALSEMNVPPVVDILSGSAIAIHQTTLLGGQRVGYSKADFIFSKVGAPLSRLAYRPVANAHRDIRPRGPI